MTPICRSPWMLLAAAHALLLVPVAAQVPYYPGQPQDPRRQIRDQMTREAAREQMLRARRLQQYTFPYNTLSPDLPFGFQLQRGTGARGLLPLSPGLPEFGATVPGYGGYPGLGNPDQPARRPGAPGLRENRPGAWPGWVPEGSNIEDLPAAAERGLLVRISDAVWFLGPEERAYVPLAHYDRFRYLVKGCRVRVRTGGTFESVFFDSCRLRSNGACELGVEQLDEELLALDCRSLTNLWIDVRTRPLRLRLPDGSQVDCQGASLHLRRLEDRIRLQNSGRTEVRLRGGFGERRLPGLSQVDLWLQPPQAGEPQGARAQLRGLRDLDAATGSAGRRRQQATGTGTLDLGSARLEVRAGQVVEQARLPAPRFENFRHE